MTLPPLPERLLRLEQALCEASHRIDIDKIHRMMVAVKWQWSTSEGMVVPDKDTIRDHMLDFLMAIRRWAKANPDQPWTTQYSHCGGWSAYLTEDYSDEPGDEIMFVTINWGLSGDGAA